MLGPLALIWLTVPRSRYWAEPPKSHSTQQHFINSNWNTIKYKFINYLFTTYQKCSAILQSVTSVGVMRQSRLLVYIQYIAELTSLNYKQPFTCLSWIIGCNACSSFSHQCYWYGNTISVVQSVKNIVKESFCHYYSIIYSIYLNHIWHFLTEPVQWLFKDLSHSQI